MDCRNVDYVCPMFISPVNYGEHFPFVSMSVTSEAAKVELKFALARQSSLWYGQSFFSERDKFSVVRVDRFLPLDHYFSLY
jgi:hypothetical protein